MVISCSIAAQGLTLFNDSYIHEIRFTSVDTMIFINNDDYQSIDMTFDGFQVNDIGLKQKGNISASHANNKMPFKVKTNKYVSKSSADNTLDDIFNVLSSHPVMASNPSARAASCPIPAGFRIGRTRTRVSPDYALAGNTNTLQMPMRPSTDLVP